MLPLIKRAALMVSVSDKPNYTTLARLLSAPRPALYAWGRIPAEYVLKLEAITKGKITRWQMRPDLYPPSEYRKRA